MKINPWFRCKCGKLHIGTYINRTTTCSCGELLYNQIPIRSMNARGGIK